MRPQTRHLNSFIVISEDFNHAILYHFAKVPPVCQLCYQKEQNTGSPRYLPVVLRQSVTKKSIRRWSQDSEEALQISFEATHWEPTGEDINKMTNYKMNYTDFCMDAIFPLRSLGKL